MNIWQIIWQKKIEIIGGLLALYVVLALFFFLYIVLFYEPEIKPLSEADLNPINAPFRGEYQIESKGLRSIEMVHSPKRQSWLRVVDSKGLCYTIDDARKRGSEHNMRFFAYRFVKPDKPVPPHQAGLRIYYLRGTVQWSHESQKDPRPRNIRKYGLARSSTDQWKDCANGAIYSMSIMEIRYLLNGEHYHFKISDELEREFQQDLVQTFR